MQRLTQVGFDSDARTCGDVTQDASCIPSASRTLGGTVQYDTRRIPQGRNLAMEECDRDATHDAMRDVTRDVTCDVMHDATHDVTHDVMCDMTHDTTRDVTRDVTYDVTHVIPSQTSTNF